MLSDKYLGLCWDETCVDGALAENCTYIEHILNNVIGSKLISPVSKIIIILSGETKMTDRILKLSLEIYQPTVSND